MTPDNQHPGLKQILGALLFGAKKPLTAAEIRKLLAEVAAEHEGHAREIANTKEPEIYAALEKIKIDLIENHSGFHLAEVGGGFRLQTDMECGLWLRRLLDLGKPSRLSRPALETLAIIAYRQPIPRSEIETVRGVNVDSIVRNLLELQLIRIIGKSDLPGRPMIYGTTQLFLEHFGMKSVKDLPGIEQLCRREEERYRKAVSTAATPNADNTAEPEPAENTVNPTPSAPTDDAPQ